MNKIVCKNCGLYSSFADVGVCKICFMLYQKEMFGIDDNGVPHPFAHLLKDEEKSIYNHKMNNWLNKIRIK